MGNVPSFHSLLCVDCEPFYFIIECWLSKEGTEMNQYVTGEVIKSLREQKKITQLQLAEKLGVSDKTISKWKTGN